MQKEQAPRKKDKRAEFCRRALCCRQKQPPVCGRLRRLYEVPCGMPFCCRRTGTQAGDFCEYEKVGIVQRIISSYKLIASQAESFIFQKPLPACQEVQTYLSGKPCLLVWKSKPACQEDHIGLPGLPYQCLRSGKTADAAQKNSRPVLSGRLSGGKQSSFSRSGYAVRAAVVCSSSAA